MFPVEDFIPRVSGYDDYADDEPTGKDFDPLDLVDKLAAANLNSSAIVVDEMNDLPKAANVVEWMNDPRFCNQDPPALPKSIECLLSVYEEFCPGCTDPKLLRALTIETVTPGGSIKRFRKLDLRLPTDISQGDILDRVALLNFGVCPRCKKTRRDFVQAGLFHNPLELVLVAGQRSTKTTTVVLGGWSYVVHRFLMVAQPARRFGIPRGQYLETFFTAITKEQAYKTLWKQAMMVYDNSPWFNQCASLLKAKGRELGVLLYQKEKTYVAFPGKNIACSYGPPDGASQRGRTRIFGAVSEWGWFAKAGVDTRKKIRANEDDIYTAVVNSLLTVRSGCARLREGDWFDAPNAPMFNEGSPLDEQDKGMRLLREGEESPRVICRHYSTFEFNFNLKPEDIVSPAPGTPEFERDYLARPPMASNPLFEDPKKVDAAVDPGRLQGLSYTVETLIQDVNGKASGFLWAQPNGWPTDRFAPRVLAIDAGETQNSFGLVLIRVDPGLRSIVEGVVEIIPDKEQHVHFPHMLDKFILPLCEKLSVRFLVWDRWQSTEAIQRARLRGINADRRSLRPAEFLEFKQRVLAGRLRLPMPEVDVKKLVSKDPKRGAPFPVARLVLQCQTVRKIGQRVEKPLNGTDDIFRALVLADTVAEEHRQILTARVDDRGLPLERVVGVMGSFANRSDIVGGVLPSRLGAVARSSSRGSVSPRWPR